MINDNEDNTQTIKIRVIELRVVCRDCEKTMLAASVQDLADGQMAALADQIAEKSPLEVVIE